ncbi:MAG: Na+-transporting NADH:ubiquinone oxidoreductase subunit B [Flammeovirgaceae bacterium]|jgi:Na+-transporting NADH:ubiquinone oxidoreductase subunit B
MLEKQKPLFEKGGKFEKFYYLWEANETFLFTPATTTRKTGVQVRDAIDLKRLMMTVVIAMVPCLLFGIWNTGEQHFIAIGQEATFLDKIWIGSYTVLPLILVSYAAGGLAEAVFAIARKHPINEGFLVTGMLVPLVCPATLPLWQMALANIFAVVIAKEVFGGTGMNVLNVAMTARAFLYFAYPQQISGSVWTYLGDEKAIDGYSGATPLSIAASTVGEGGVLDKIPTVVEQLAAVPLEYGQEAMYSLQNLIVGVYPGSIGSTSIICVAIGAVILIATGVASWRIIFGTMIGAAITAFGVELLAVNQYMAMPFHYHLVIGGLAFAAVFMATDPVSASHTFTGKWIYGLLIGFFTIIIRVFNPAYPEGVMLAVLLMNVFAPLIDFYVIQANKKRRIQRAKV